MKLFFIVPIGFRLRNAMVDTWDEWNAAIASGVSAETLLDLHEIPKSDSSKRNISDPPKGLSFFCMDGGE